MSKLNSKKLLSLSLSIILIAGFFFVAPAARASFSTWAGELVGGIIGILISALGLILVLVIQGLVLVASYQNFIGSQAVVLGWVIVRDICNMFFVVVLMIIAFGTILHLENYSYKKWLPKLVLMAILINFSKTICGLMIDVAQVAMLTFVNSFKDIAGGNFTEVLGISAIVTMAKNSTDAGFWTIVGAYVLGLIYLIVAIVVIATMLMMLVMRLVMIWIYVVLSPAAYLLAAFPGGQKYSSQWWDEFIKNLIVGPVLAFFIWLSLASLQADNIIADERALAAAKKKSDAESGNIAGSSAGGAGDQTEGVALTGTEASTPEALIKFVVAIGMLVGGLMISQQIGGAAGKIAGSGMSALQKGKSLAKDGIKGLGKFAGRRLGDVRDVVSEHTGVDLNLKEVWKRRNEQSEANRQLRLARIRKNTLKTAEEGKTWVGRKMALASTGDVAWQNLVDKKFNILKAGSPKKETDTLDNIKAVNANKETVQQDIENLKDESSRVVTAQEDAQNQALIANLQTANADLSSKKNNIINSQAYRDLERKEKDFTITESEEKELENKRKQVGKIDTNIKKNNESMSDLARKDIIRPDDTAKAAFKAQKDADIAIKEGEMKKLDDEISKLTEALSKNKLSEIQTARASINAKLEGEANKKIANINSSDQLVSIFKEAIESKDEGLIAASYKRLAKQGNYNDIHRELGFGTGYEGMLKMSEHLQKEGGMTEQDSRALISDIGELCKSVKHYEAFGVMSMNKAGKWEVNKPEEQEAAIFSEKAKIQVQQYVRDGNRLANGSYSSGKPHTGANWNISRSSIALFASKDKQYAEELMKTGNVNSIMFMAENPENLRKLEANGAKEVAKVIRDIADKAKSKGANVANPKATIMNVIT